MSLALVPATTDVGVVDLVTANGQLALPVDLDWDTWADHGRRILQAGAGARWWVGDWLIYAEDHLAERDDEGQITSQSEARIRQLAANGTPLDDSSYRHAKRVARAFPPVRRRTGLSWSHHETVAKLAVVDANAADDLLIWAEHHEASQDDLRAELKRREAIDTTAVEAEPKPKPARATVKLVAVDLTIDDEALYGMANRVAELLRSQLEQGGKAELVKVNVA